MNILLDHCVPVRLRHKFPSEYIVHSAAFRGWHELENGALISMAEKENYHVLITSDQRIRYQQNIVDRKIAILILTSNQYREILPNMPILLRNLRELKEGNYCELTIPPLPKTSKDDKKF